ncbi:MAG TPA: hypothetical protein VJP79_06305 [Nitrososphaera sp.]|nr:hypothetical protein [Nitrososphaera sp.]
MASREAMTSWQRAQNQSVRRAPKDLERGLDDMSSSSGSNPTTSADRAGVFTGHQQRQPPPTNEAEDRAKASRLANLLEGVDFPATKGQIIGYINAHSKHDKYHHGGSDSIVREIESSLHDGATYSSIYDVALAMGLVNKRSSQEKAPVVRDKALNRANNRRTGETIRPDPYGGRVESVGTASSKDVSPNTPHGEPV